MRVRRLLRRFCPLTVLVLLGLAACSKRETPAEAGLRTQTLLLGNAAEPADLDPQIITAYTDGNIILALFEGLTVLDERTSQPVPAAAERWEVSADQLTWTFHLRSNLKWSNGEPLVAADFVASWRRLLSPALGAENATYLHAVKNAEAFNKGDIKDPAAVGVAAPDDRTVVVTLARPTPYFAMLTAQPATYPVNRRVLEKFGAIEKRGTAWTRPGNLVGNGPFALKEWTPNARVSVGPNPHYWDAARVRLREIVFFPTENPDTDERAFRAGQIHATFTLPIAKVDGWRTREPAKLRVDPFSQTVFLRFNTTRAPFSDPRVRRALSLAIDREAIARTVLRGGRPPAFALCPPGIGGYTARAKAASDVVAARAALAAAGHANGAGLPAIELQCRNDEIQPQLAEVLQAAWQRELGLKVTIGTSEQKTWLQNQQTLNYTVTIASWIADFPDPVNFLNLFMTGGGYNWTGWGNANYDDFVNTAERTADAQQRHDLLQRAEALLLDEAAIAPIFHGAQTYLLDPAVKNWPPAPLGTRRYQGVWLEK